MCQKYETEVDQYDETLYNLSVSDDETASNFMITLGVGVEKGFDFGYIFTDAKQNLTSNEENRQALEVEIPASVMLNVGHRYMF